MVASQQGSSPFRLDGRKALITGGGSGLGFPMASALADAGARVVLVGRNEEKLETRRRRSPRAARRRNGSPPI